MTTPSKSPRAVKERPIAYENFIGLETIRARNNQDTGKRQPLAVLSNGYADPIGQIVRDPGVTRIQSGVNIAHAKHYDLFSLLWFERLSDGLYPRSTTGAQAPTFFTAGASPSSVHFGDILYTFAQGETPVAFNGTAFEVLPATKPLSNRLRPAFATTVASRLVVGGMPQYPNVIEISRVNDVNFFSEEEAKDSENVLRGFKIDLGNQLKNNERITGLATFENDKLIIFTTSRGLIYRTGENIEDWGIESRTSISAGCISHNTIQEANGDVLYCSRTGVQTVRRSRENGVMIYSLPLSFPITTLYRELVRGVSDIKDISAAFDADESQYHVFFPFEGAISRRLTLTLDPTDLDSSGTWSLSESFLSTTCGDYADGSLIYGTPDGLFQVAKVEEETAGKFPDLSIETPDLFLGSFTDHKSLAGLVLSCAGKSYLNLELIDAVTGKVIWSRYNVEAEPGTAIADARGTPLNHNRRVPVNVRTTACRLRVKACGTGQFRFAGFALIVGE